MIALVSRAHLQQLRIAPQIVLVRPLNCARDHVRGVTMPAVRLQQIVTCTSKYSGGRQRTIVSQIFAWAGVRSAGAAGYGGGFGATTERLAADFLGMD